MEKVVVHISFHRLIFTDIIQQGSDTPSIPPSHPTQTKKLLGKINAKALTFKRTKIVFHSAPS